MLRIMRIDDTIDETKFVLIKIINVTYELSPDSVFINPWPTSALSITEKINKMVGIEVITHFPQLEFNSLDVTFGIGNLLEFFWR